MKPVTTSLALLCVTLAACGGGSSSNDNSPQPGAAEAFSSSSAKLGGLYINFGASAQGSIHELALNADQSFQMTVQGLIDCKSPGHSCPSTFTDGPSGVTDLVGMWTESAGTVHLTPKDGTRTGTAFDLQMNASGTKMTVSGHLGATAVHDDLVIHAKAAAAHSVKDADLDGAWKVTSSGSSDNPQTIWGLSTGGGDHTVVFDSKGHTVTEDPPTKGKDQNLGTSAPSSSAAIRRVILGSSCSTAASRTTSPRSKSTA
jgi:hypothetical protein